MGCTHDICTCVPWFLYNYWVCDNFPQIMGLNKGRPISGMPRKLSTLAQQMFYNKPNFNCKYMSWNVAFKLLQALLAKCFGFMAFSHCAYCGPALSFFFRFFLGLHVNPCWIGIVEGWSLPITSWHVIWSLTNNCHLALSNFDTKSSSFSIFLKKASLKLCFNPSMSLWSNDREQHKTIISCNSCRSSHGMCWPL